MTQIAPPLNLETATGHQVLAAAGKKILRPGGRAATEQLFTWANFQPDQTVLELASSFGYSAIALAQKYGVRVVGVEKNPESVARARANVAAAGLSDRIQIIEGDIFKLDQITEQFDYVLAEAILTMQSAPGKAKILSGIADRLKPGGKFLSHELLARQQEAEIQRTLAQTIRVNSNPLSEANWTAAIETAGLNVKQIQIGAMGLLNPRQVINDEGISGTLKILWNVLTKPAIRTRVLGMRKAFLQYRHDLGYIVSCSEKPIR
ncbi:SAM-dependent methyltransferase [Leptolyngbya ohadii]|uniref:SAM-dependent methyltransferase n=1 Tax=Leptolyngbya ohadii TaxID=1962290 RepID=UPI000B59DE21|nr:class I SAM-dependent methyltransferase [Leptolyngbya ohadii]